MRIILSAGVCSIALSGCIPAAAGLALSAASLFTGGNNGQGGQGFKNPIDRHTTGQQVRQALSRMNDQVDPNCQAMLDEHLKTHGTLTPGAPAKTAAAGDQTGAPATAAPAPEKPAPVNLLAKLDPQSDSKTGGDVAVSADKAADATAAAPKTPETAVAAVNPADASGEPVKASLGGHGSPAPGQCEHRLVCLPGTPKPTLMLMCPGKGDPKMQAKGSGTDQVGQDTASVDGDAAQPPAQPKEQTTAALGAGDGATDPAMEIPIPGGAPSPAAVKPAESARAADPAMEIPVV